MPTPDYSTVRFSPPNPFEGADHLAFSGCTVNGRCTWGYRIECLTCGEVQSTEGGSSVSYEDAPRYFAHRHAGCKPLQPTGLQTTIHKGHWVFVTSARCGASTPDGGIRRVEILKVEGDTATVRALYGPLAGSTYEVPAEAVSS